MGGAGLHGRAFIPLLSSFACAIPGIMATRVIDQKRDRLTTILVAPLTTCSARIPVYTLIISAFVPDAQLFGWVSEQGLVMLGLYATGILSGAGGGVRDPQAVLARRVRAVPDGAAGLQDARRLERRPHGLQRGEIFLKRAGTIILSMMVIVWSCPTCRGRPPAPTDPAIDYSFAGMIGHVLQPLLRPIGFSWQMSVALIPGMAAREVAVGALGTVYAVTAATTTPAAWPHPGWPLVAGLGPVFPGLVRVRATMRLDLGRGETRDQFLEMARDHVRLHDHPGLSRGAGRLPNRHQTLRSKPRRVWGPETI